MFVYRQMRIESQNLNFARHAVIEQNLRVPATGKIAEMDIQVGSPAVYGSL